MKKKYFVYFNAFDKKLKVEVEASTPDEACAYVRKCITIEKVEEFQKGSSNESSMYGDKLFKKIGDFFKRN